MSDQLQKLASDLPAVLTTTAEHLRKMASSQVAKDERIAELSHELSAYKLARRMEQRNLSSELDFEAKVASLLEFPEEKLASMDQAIELATGGFRLGTHETDDKTASDVTAPGADPLGAWITSNAAFNP
jgi:DNA-binding transcriptional regulator YbjK